MLDRLVSGGFEIRPRRMRSSVSSRRSAFLAAPDAGCGGGGDNLVVDIREREWCEGICSAAVAEKTVAGRS